MKKLYKDFRNAYKSARDAESASTTTAKSSPSLWLKSMRDFLDRRLHSQFEVQSYILDPTKVISPNQGIAGPQSLSGDSDPLNKDPFDGLIKIDIITAQRGFSDPKTDDESYSGFASLSTQLHRYFSKHLNPSEAPDASDIEALEAIEEAKTVFDEKLMKSFKPAIKELEDLNYPGFSDPKISIKSKVDPRDSLDHEAAVQFDLPGSDSLFLPEKHNGLTRTLHEHREAGEIHDILNNCRVFSNFIRPAANQPNLCCRALQRLADRIKRRAERHITDADDRFTVSFLAIENTFGSLLSGWDKRKSVRNKSMSLSAQCVLLNSKLRRISKSSLFATITLFGIGSMLGSRI